MTPIGTYTEGMTYCGKYVSYITLSLVGEEGDDHVVTAIDPTSVEYMEDETLRPVRSAISDYCKARIADRYRKCKCATDFCLYLHASDGSIAKIRYDRGEAATIGKWSRD